MVKRLCILVVSLLVAQYTFADNVVEKREIKPFSKIDVSGGIDVYLEQGDNISCKVEAPAFIINEIVTEVEGNTLVIKIKGNNFWKNFNSERVYITVKQLDKITASAGSDVYGKSSINTDQLFIESSGGSDVKLNVYAQKIGIESKSGSDIHISGEASYLIAVANGGSDIYAEELKVKSAQLKASGGSDIRSRVIKELEAVASGGSDIYYYGDPKVLKKDISVSATIHKKE